MSSNKNHSIYIRGLSDTELREIDRLRKNKSRSEFVREELLASLALKNTKTQEILCSSVLSALKIYNDELFEEFRAHHYLLLALLKYAIEEESFEFKDQIREVLKRNPISDHPKGLKPQK